LLLTAAGLPEGPGSPRADSWRAGAADSLAPSASPRIQEIVFEGNHRTASDLARSVLGLSPGDPADPAALLAAADRLRDAHLFRSVRVHTRPGSRPGRVVVVFTVEERRPHLRLGAGYEDLSGWYLIPVQLDMDNLTGHGEMLRLGLRVGYRVGGFVLDLRRPGMIRGRGFWHLQMRAENLDRIYFLDDAELNQRVERRTALLRLGRPAGNASRVAAWLAVESVQADSHAVVYNTPRSGERERGDEIPYEDLPGLIRAGVPRRVQTRVGLSLEWDTRRGEGLERAGFRGRIEAEGVLSPEGDFPAIRADLRSFVGVARGIQLALRTRVMAVGPNAPFFERPYLGGLYTVRGFPSQSLSPPEGSRSLVTLSGELRTAWIGPPENPILVGQVFLDVGTQWSTGAPEPSATAVGIGYGFRIRLPWVRRLGVDVAFPLTRSPVEEAFHVNASLGWTF
jgi:outer membrane protein insertion porin family